MTFRVLNKDNKFGVCILCGNDNMVRTVFVVMGKWHGKAQMGWQRKWGKLKCENACLCLLLDFTEGVKILLLHPYVWWELLIFHLILFSSDFSGVSVCWYFTVLSWTEVKVVKFFFLHLLTWLYAFFHLYYVNLINCILWF